MVLHSICAKCWEGSRIPSRPSIHFCDLEPVHQRLLVGFDVPEQGSREVKRVAMNKVSQEHKLEYSPCNEKCKHAKTHATCRYRRTGNISLVKNHVTG